MSDAPASHHDHSSHDTASHVPDHTFHHHHHHHHDSPAPHRPEHDPLLPRDDPAPEISGGGYGAAYGTTSDTLHNRRRRGQGANGADQSTGEKVVSRLAIIVFIVIAFIILRAQFSSNDPVSRPLPPRYGNPVPIPAPDKPRTIKERVTKILIDTPLIDGHNDLAIFIRAAYKNDIASDTFRHKFEQGNMTLQVDLPRLRRGMVGGAFWSAFVLCPEHASTNFSDAEYATSVSETLQQIDLIKRLQHQYPRTFTPAGTDLRDMLSQFHGTRSMFGPISIEGLHQVPQSAPMSTLRLFYALGVRAATLTWNCHNAFADAALIWTRTSLTPTPYHRGGLTARGRQVLTEMNRLGIIIDISHTSYWTQKAVLSNDTSRAPVVFTHSSAFTLCPHPRNVKDDILALVQRTNSLVMVNFSPEFVSCVGDSDGNGMPKFYAKNNTLHQVARHIMYIGDKIGYDHVGLGSDFDGLGELTPKGLEGVDKYPDLIAELLRHNVSDVDASKVVGGNLLRVWSRVEEVSRQMHVEGVPEGQDPVPDIYSDTV